MLPYYFLVFFPFFIEAIGLNLFSLNRNVFLEKKNNSSIIVFFLILFTLLSLRSESCGIDLKNYRYMFQTTQYLNFGEVFSFYSTEQLFFAFNWVVGYVYPDFRLFMVIVALLCTGVTGWFYWKESKCAPLTMLLFVINPCIFMFYSGLRQALAMLFVIPAYYMILKRKIIPFIIIVFVTCYFHTSALVMLFLYPAFYTPIKSRHFVIVLLLVVVVFLFKSQIFFFVLPFLAKRYIELYGQITDTGSYAMWVLFILFLTYAFCISDEEKMSSKQLGLRNILVVMTVIQCFAPIHPIAMRFNLYFIMLLPIIVPELLIIPRKGNENIAQISKWVMVCFFLFFFFFRAEPGDGLNAIPYRFFWE